jgi:hypothetical protein
VISTIYTLKYLDTPAQLLGILWDSDKGDTGLAIVRLKGEGRFLRAVHPSKLTPMPARDLRPDATPRSEGSNG